MGRGWGEDRNKRNAYILTGLRHGILRSSSFPKASEHYISWTIPLPSNSPFFFSLISYEIIMFFLWHMYLPLFQSNFLHYFQQVVSWLFQNKLIIIKCCVIQVKQPNIPLVTKVTLIFVPLWFCGWRSNHRNGKCVLLVSCLRSNPPRDGTPFLSRRNFTRLKESSPGSGGVTLQKPTWRLK